MKTFLKSIAAVSLAEAAPSLRKGGHPHTSPTKTTEDAHKVDSVSDADKKVVYTVASNFISSNKGQLNLVEG